VRHASRIRPQVGFAVAIPQVEVTDARHLSPKFVQGLGELHPDDTLTESSPRLVRTDFAGHTHPVAQVQLGEVVE